MKKIIKKRIKGYIAIDVNSINPVGCYATSIFKSKKELGEHLEQLLSITKMMKSNMKIFSVKFEYKKEANNDH